jgi:hypothetical protein
VGLNPTIALAKDNFNFGKFQFGLGPHREIIVLADRKYTPIAVNNPVTEMSPSASKERAEKSPILTPPYLAMNLFKKIRLVQ